MELKGQCKKDFEKWFESDSKLKPMITIFDRLPPSMQYGVYVDYFDSVGVDIEFSRMYDDFMVVINHKTYGKWLKTRHEARTEAIQKADQIHNERKQ